MQIYIAFIAIARKFIRKIDLLRLKLLISFGRKYNEVY